MHASSHSENSLLLRRFVFRMAEASAKRVTGDEPQGTMGRVQTARSVCLSRLPLRARFQRDVWVRGSSENVSSARRVELRGRIPKQTSTFAQHTFQATKTTFPLNSLFSLRYSSEKEASYSILSTLPSRPDLFGFIPLHTVLGHA